MFEERYREDYPGEFVVVNTTWVNGKREQTREWIPNPIENKHISGRAACIGSSVDKWQFDYSILQNHRGGLLASKKLQTYGVGSLAREMKYDFVVENNIDTLSTLVESLYTQTNVVYTSATNCLKYPGEFYLIPNAPQLIPMAMILYLAAFDGHKEIYMLGYNNETPADSLNWIKQISTVMGVYNSTKFIIPGIKSNIPAEWQDHENCEIVSYRDFITTCDV